MSQKQKIQRELESSRQEIRKLYKSNKIAFLWKKRKSTMIYFLAIPTANVLRKMIFKSQKSSLKRKILKKTIYFGSFWLLKKGIKALALNYIKDKIKSQKTK